MEPFIDVSDLFPVVGVELLFLALASNKGGDLPGPVVVSLLFMYDTCVRLVLSVCVSVVAVARGFLLCLERFSAAAVGRPFVPVRILYF